LLEPLDGDADGFPGGDHAITFAIANAPVTMAVPDLARGPGQPVNVPMAAQDAGLPLRLTSGGGVTAVEFNLRHDPSLLQVTGFLRGVGLPADVEVNVNVATAGLVRVRVTRPQSFPAGTIELIRLTAVVPENAVYGRKHVLDLTDLRVNGGGLAALDDDGLHVVAYLGDATGSAGYSTLDATRALQAALGLESGFARYPLADPVILADIGGDGRLGVSDATRILQQAMGYAPSQVPPLPPHPPTVPVSGPDLLLFLPKTFRGRPGDEVLVPIYLDPAQGLETADLIVSYDTRRLEVLSERAIRRGSLTADFDIFLVNLDSSAGTIRAGLGRTAGPIRARGSGSVLEIVFRIRADAPSGSALINLRHGAGGTRTQLNEGGLVLMPAPLDRSGDGLDGQIVIDRPGPVLRQEPGAGRPVRRDAGRPPLLPADAADVLRRLLEPGPRRLPLYAAVAERAILRILCFRLRGA
jgi:hypothetical protein